AAPPPTATGPSAPTPPPTPTRTAASSRPGLGWTDPWIFRWPSTPEPSAPEVQAPALPFVPFEAPITAAPSTPLPAQPLPPLPEGMRQINGVPSGVLAVDPRGGTVVIGSTAGVQVWDLEAGHMVRTLEA